MAHNKIWSSWLMTPAIDGQNAAPLWREKPQEFGPFVAVHFLGTLPSHYGGRKRIALNKNTTIAFK